MRVIAALLILGELLEYLALPVLFALIGALNGFGWQWLCRPCRSGGADRCPDRNDVWKSL